MSNLSYIEKHEGWAELVINRPDRRNSLTPHLADEIREHLAALATDDDVSCIILRGEAGYFCSGIDLKALQSGDSADYKGPGVRGMHIALYNFDKPIIGALEKFAINAGAALAMACDLVIGGETAFFQIGEIQQGAPIPMNAAWLKLKTTEFAAARLALYGDRISMDNLVGLGLANETVKDEEVVIRCRELASTIASFPKGAGRSIKQTLINQRGIDDPENFFPRVQNNALMKAKMLID